ncbi:MAG: 50S ribosomal protein L4 [Brooklawnia sp.]
MSETLKLDVLDAKGKKAGQVELPAEVFGAETNVPLIHQVVVAQQAAARQGTHATKTRGDVRGGGRKPWRQKGTGRARHGSTRSPQWTGGGVAHGPQPRGYAQRTPKKMIAAALRGTLSDRAREGLIFVVDQIVEAPNPSTRQAAARLAGLGEFTRYLVVLDRDDHVGWLSLRNLPGVHVIVADQLNAYDVVVSDALVFTQAAFDAFVGAPAQADPEVAEASTAAVQEESQEDDK